MENGGGEGLENKEIIVELLKLLLTATRAGQDIDKLMLSEDQATVTIQFNNGYKKEVCVEADSGISLIKDVINRL